MNIQREYLQTIADAIRERDGTTGLVQAKTFAQRIQDMPNRKPSYPLDPQEVYEATRPADWLPMPEPRDDEMYLLFHIPDGFSSLLAFTVTCTGGYTVALGTVHNGAFLQASSTVLSSGDKYETELFARDWGDLTGDGMKQVMVKVSGTDVLTWVPSAHSKKAFPVGFSAWNIVEIACRLPEGTKVSCCINSNYADSVLSKLKYFSWLGNNKMQTTTTMFFSCYSLLTVISLDTSHVTNMSNMFYNCHSLLAIPQMDTRQVTNMFDLFCGCSSFLAAPRLDTSRVTNMGNMFYACESICQIPQMDTSQVTSMYRTFMGCRSLSVIHQLDTSNVSNIRNLVDNCYGLTDLTLSPDVGAWAGYDISLAGCSFSRDALVKLFKSLPVVTNSPTLTIYGNPGVSDLTDADRAVATAKGWALNEAVPSSNPGIEGPESFDEGYSYEGEPYQW